MALAKRESLDTLPIGEIIARIGQTFVGNPYVPGTLEAEGPEKLVVNLRTFDCVTFVENTLALARTIKARGDYARYKAELAHIRYRGGRMDGYPSRLHYFSDWIADNESKGVVRNLTRELGGIADPEPITFMTSHTDAYRQLKDTALVSEIRSAEARLTAAGRLVIPEDSIEGISDLIRNGDVIAAATNVKGLDIAHTGIALWVDGTLRLMHAPLVGSTVQISPNTLAGRIKASGSQDGIMVARPR
ncbi:MAG TPA: N-acetylmuramoyl-L-alanine amidase-like domain-containing protein [Longimicrobiales bacterium]